MSTTWLRTESESARILEATASNDVSLHNVSGSGVSKTRLKNVLYLYVSIPRGSSRSTAIPCPFSCLYVTHTWCLYIYIYIYIVRACVSIVQKNWLYSFSSGSSSCISHALAHLSRVPRIYSRTHPIVRVVHFHVRVRVFSLSSPPHPPVLALTLSSWTVCFRRAQLSCSLRIA